MKNSLIVTVYINHEQSLPILDRGEIALSSGAIEPITLNLLQMADLLFLTLTCASHKLVTKCCEPPAVSR